MTSTQGADAWRSLEGCRVLLPSSCGFPAAFVRLLGEAAAGGGSYELVVGLTFSGFGFLGEMDTGVRVTTWQYAPGAAGSDRVAYLPLRYSQLLPSFAPGGAYPVDALVLHLSPPDADGYCSLGVSPSYLAPLAMQVPRRVGVINHRMPATAGHQRVHIRDLDHVVELTADLDVFERPVPSELDARVARNLAGLVEDGATLQVGLGGIPEALPAQLSDRRDLGLYGMMTDGAMDLIRAGVITGARYTPAPGTVEVGEVVGTAELFSFVDGNEAVRAVSVDYAMDPTTFARIPALVAVNSAIEVDLSGQVNAETIGHRVVSGAGGQCDYMQGAAMSPGGISVIALRSTTSDGRSRIVSALASGSVVTTPRTAVSHVVTEHGVAELHGRTLRQRADALVAIAAPEHRDALLDDLHRFSVP
jgi:4-hydroxybutyrate CoA-transferase